MGWVSLPVKTNTWGRHSCAMCRRFTKPALPHTRMRLTVTMPCDWISRNTIFPDFIPVYLTGFGNYLAEFRCPRISAEWRLWRQRRCLGATLGASLWGGSKLRPDIVWHVFRCRAPASFAGWSTWNNWTNDLTLKGRHANWSR